MVILGVLSNFPADDQKPEQTDEVLCVLDEVMYMRANSTDTDNGAQRRRSSIVKMGETYVFSIEEPTNKSTTCSDTEKRAIPVKTHDCICSKPNSSDSSYEVIDNATQMSTKSTSSSTTDYLPPSEGDMRGTFSKEWTDILKPSTMKGKTIPKEHQSQDMIETLKRAVKEGNVKAQESVKEFYQPTPEELNRIRKESVFFHKVSVVC